MKRLFFQILHVFTVCLFINSLVAQSYLEIFEETKKGEVRSVSDTSARIIDANSTLLIKINQTNVQDEIFKFEGISKSDPRLAELKKLNTILEAEIDILTLLNDISEKEGNNYEAYKKLARLKIQVYKAIKNNKDLYTELARQGAAANTFVKEKRGPYIVFVLNFLESKAENIRQNLYLGLEAGEDNRVYFRLAAFLKNKQGGRPVHIENFDNYDAESYNQLELFSTPLTSEDRQTIEDHKELTDKLQGNLSTGIINAQKMLEASVDSLFTSDEALTQFKKQILDFKNTLQIASNDTVENFLQGNLSSLDDANLLYSSIQSIFLAFSGNFSLAPGNGGQIEARIEDIVKRIDSVLDDIPENIDQFEQSNVHLLTNNDTIKTGIEKIRKKYASVRTSVDRDISNLQKLVRDLKNILNPFKKAYLASEEIGEEVKRFTAGNIPDVGYLDLKYIGERKPGDEILIKAVLEKGKNPSTNVSDKKTLYRKFFSVALVSAHVKMSGSLVLANPYNRKNNSDIHEDLNTFQFAPTYGVFLKWGSRKSKFHNEFLTPGIGLAFSSPDFSLDGTPEFGASVMITLFRDFIGAGWGYNFGVNTPYYFVGFNIPFNIGGLGGVDNSFDN